MTDVNWSIDKDSEMPLRGMVHWITNSREIKIKLYVDMVNNAVEFHVNLCCGRIESTIVFTENIPIDCKTDSQVRNWIKSNVDQLVQNALVKLLTTAVGFFS